MQTRLFLFAKLYFYERVIRQTERKRERGREMNVAADFPRSRDTSITRYRVCDSTCTTNPCNNLAPRRRVKCANVGNRHESVRKPVELQPSPVIKYEERRCDVGLKSSSDGRHVGEQAETGRGRREDGGRRVSRGWPPRRGQTPFGVISPSHATFNIEGCFLTFNITLGGGF